MVPLYVAKPLHGPVKMCIRDRQIKTEIKKYACGMIGGSVYSSLYELADLLTTAET